MKELIYSVVHTFHLLDCDIDLLSSETVYGWKTVAIIGDNIHYLEDKLISLETAINFWQEFRGRMMTQKEIRFVMEANIPKLMK